MSIAPKVIEPAASHDLLIHDIHKKPHMNFLSKLLVPSIAGLAVVAAACSDSGGARRIDAGGSETITTVGDIDIQDYLNAVDQLTEDLLARGVLNATGPDGETFVEIDRVKNDTSRPGVDIGQITERLRENILNSGQALVLTPRGESAMAGEREQRDRFTGDANRDDYPEPDYYLTGRLSNLGSRAGSVRQQNFTFRLTLTDTRGVERWIENVDITKQGKRNSVGR